MKKIALAFCALLGLPGFAFAQANAPEDRLQQSRAVSTAREPGEAGSDGLAFWLCALGLLGVFAVGYPGYFVFNSIWPNFYYGPNIAGKNAWLLGQAFFFAVYFTGAVLAFNSVRRALDGMRPAAQ